MSSQWIALALMEETSAQIAHIKCRNYEFVALCSIVLKSDREFWLVTAVEEAARGARGTVLGPIEHSRALGDLNTAFGDPTTTLECYLVPNWTTSCLGHHRFPGTIASWS